MEAAGGDVALKLYCDTGNLADFERTDVAGFTTNPSLCRAAGVGNYPLFVRDAALAAGRRPVSLEVTATTRAEILRQAHVLASYPNAYVKIPACDAAGHPHFTLIRQLVREEVRVNVTAILALHQVEPLVDVLFDTPAIVSIFAGRIADTGRDPCPVVFRAAELLKGHRQTRILWASTRELYNIVQAEQSAADIITLSPALLDKWQAMRGKGLRKLAEQTVAQFDADAQAAGFTL